MQTVSINVCTLCVPCANRCRYCLLSYDGKCSGADYERSKGYARRFFDWLKANRPELSFAFYWGYSMEHPDLAGAIDFAREIGSPAAKFLQMDGLKFRSEPEIRELLTMVKGHGVEAIDLTFYGLEDYHDRFAARRGDFAYMMQILKIANEIGLDVNAGMPLTRENAAQAGELLEQLNQFRLKHIYFFVPHAEGRGEGLNPIRLRLSDYEQLPEAVKARFNRNKFRTEGEWMQGFPDPQNRVLTLNLTRENLDFFENQPFDHTIRFLEQLDEDYHAQIPPMADLFALYADLDSQELYSFHDLALKYHRRYIAEHNLTLNDIHDETKHFSRRY